MPFFLFPCFLLCTSFYVRTCALMRAHSALALEDVTLSDKFIHASV